MHAVKLNDSEMEILRAARASMDWSILTDKKLRYIFLRSIALPAGRLDLIKEIVEFEKKDPNHKGRPDSFTVKVQKGKGKPPEIWIEQGTQKKKNVSFEEWGNTYEDWVKSLSE